MLSPYSERSLSDKFGGVGEAAQGKKLTEPLLRFGAPYGAHIGAQPYTQWQRAFDPLLTPGARNYWKSDNFTELQGSSFLVGFTREGIRLGACVNNDPGLRTLSGHICRVYFDERIDLQDVNRLTGARQLCVSLQLVKVEHLHIGGHLVSNTRATELGHSLEPPWLGNTSAYRVSWHVLNNTAL
jgi:hypothetical protein